MRQGTGAHGLGRRVDHDPRNRDYPYLARRAIPLRSVLWPHLAPVLDQGMLGSCVGHAMAQALNATRFRPARPKGRYLTQSAAVSLYSQATALDDVVGQYPPTDTGSSGLAVAKAARQRGLITRYEWCFGIDHALRALMAQPVLCGTSWYAGMDDPDYRGFVHPTGPEVGGHEYVLLGVSLGAKRPHLTFLNSWSSQWGLRGRFRMYVDEFSDLLDNQGDVTVPIWESVP